MKWTEFKAEKEAWCPNTHVSVHSPQLLHWEGDVEGVFLCYPLWSWLRRGQERENGRGKIMKENHHGSQGDGQCGTNEERGKGDNTAVWLPGKPLAAVYVLSSNASQGGITQKPVQTEGQFCNYGSFCMESSHRNKAFSCDHETKLILIYCNPIKKNKKMSYTELGLMIFFKHSHFLPEHVTCHSEKPL